MNFQTIGGRKFLLVIGCGIINAILVWYTKITSEVYGMIIVATVASYITGNVIQKPKGGTNESTAD